MVKNHWGGYTLPRTFGYGIDSTSSGFGNYMPYIVLLYLVDLRKNNYYHPLSHVPSSQWLETNPQRSTSSPGCIPNYYIHDPSRPIVISLLVFLNHACCDDCRCCSLFAVYLLYSIGLLSMIYDRFLGIYQTLSYDIYSLSTNIYIYTDITYCCIIYL